MRNKTKILLTAVLVAMISVFLIIIVSAAERIPDPPVVESDTWRQLDNVTGIDTAPDGITVSCSDDGVEYSYKITFPDAGGIRLWSTEEGFFTPGDNIDKSITYLWNKADSIRARSSNGATADLSMSGDKWILTVYNSDMFPVLALDMSDFALGYDSEDEVIQVKFGASLADDEFIQGFGEWFDSVSVVGTSFDLWNAGDWGKTPYKIVPIWHSSEGYTVFFNSSYYGKADIGKTDASKYSLCMDGPNLDFYVWTESILENLESYAEITGTNYLAPEWAYHYIAGTASTYWDSNGGRKEEKIKPHLENFMEEYKKLGTPNIAALGGEDSLWPYDSTYTTLAATGTKLLGWFRPFQIERSWLASMIGVSNDPSKYEVPYYRKLNDPSDYYTEEWYSLDFTHPNAVKFLEARYGDAIDKGLRGFMLDYGERVDVDTLAYNGMTGSEMHNFSQYYYSKLFSEYMTEKVGDDFYIYLRAACAGTQKYAGAFAGDHVGDYNGLAKVVRGGITTGAIGISNWGSDIGGLQSTSHDQIYSRWLEFAAFSPIFRDHGTVPGPWRYGESAQKVYQKYYWIRENMASKIYSSAVEASKTGAPMMQGMAIAYPDNYKLNSSEFQYIFCNDMLVRPIVDDSTKVDVSFPIGTWTNLWTGKNYSSMKTVKVDCPVDTIPVFLRAGSVIPMELNKSTLSLGDSMLNVDTEKVLMITAPDEGASRTTCFWKDSDTFIEYKLQYTSYVQNGYNDAVIMLNANTLIDEKVIIIKGTQAIDVICNNTQLRKLDSMPLDDSDIGYYVDVKGNTTYIRVSDKISNLTVFTGHERVVYTNEMRLAPFKDVNTNAWYVESLAYAVGENILRGKGNSETLAPDANITRAEFVTILSRMADDFKSSEYANAEQIFDDVAPGSWYYSAIMWAYDHRIVCGKSDTEFRPDDTMTRQEMCKMICVFADKYGLDTIKRTDAGFRDIENAWGRDYVLKLADARIVSGITDDSFSPDSTATRAQVAKILYNIFH